MERKFGRSDTMQRRLEARQKEQLDKNTKEMATAIAKEAYVIMEEQAAHFNLPLSVVLATMNKLIFESDQLYEGNGVDF